MCHVSLLAFSQLQWKKIYHFFNLWWHDIKVLIEMFWSRLHAFSSIKELQDSACMKNRNKNAMLNGLFVYLNLFFLTLLPSSFLITEKQVQELIPSYAIRSIRLPTVDNLRLSINLSFLLDFPRVADRLERLFRWDLRSNAVFTYQRKRNGTSVSIYTGKVGKLFRLSANMLLNLVIGIDNYVRPYSSSNGTGRRKRPVKIKPREYFNKLQT